MYDDLTGMKKVQSSVINLNDEKWIDILTQHLKILNVNDVVIQDIINEQTNNPKNGISKIYNDTQIYININFTFY
jgi:hypothetical protein